MLLPPWTTSVTCTVYLELGRSAAMMTEVVWPLYEKLDSSPMADVRFTVNRVGPPCISNTAVTYEHSNVKNTILMTVQLKDPDKTTPTWVNPGDVDCCVVDWVGHDKRRFDWGAAKRGYLGRGIADSVTKVIVHCHTIPVCRIDS